MRIYLVAKIVQDSGISACSERELDFQKHTLGRKTVKRNISSVVI
jgi:hypothetical protein